MHQYYLRYKQEKRRAARDKLKIKQIDRIEGINSSKVLEIRMDGYGCPNVINGKKCPNVCNVISMNCKHGTYCNECFSSIYQSLLNAKIQEIKNGALQN